jgi:flagellar hook-basal body complex protein FliE
MTVSSIEFISPNAVAGELAGLEPAATVGSFANWFARELDAVNSQLISSEKQVQQLAVGQNDNLHQVMLSLEKAKLEFELVIQIRNRLLEGYQDIMRMQV